VRIVIAGGSGFLGTRLRSHLAGRGHQIIRLVRRTPMAPDEHRWRPEQSEVDSSLLAGADAVVNLAGAGVGDRRWTASYKNEIRSSRVDPTRTLAAALAALAPGHRPALLNASAVGYYGDTGDQAVDEDSPAGDGFLTEVCVEWESATGPADEAGVRVVLMRTGLPLDAGGGLLKPLLLPFRLGIGGPIGSGRQWLPWMSMRDWLAAVTFLLDREEIAGPVNLVGPAPVRNAEFTRTLGRALHRPAVAPIPSFALRVVLGEFAVEALSSSRVVPAVLTRAGFAFSDIALEPTLRAALAT
jgi:uncharacterized protein (TIGR01777 family)